MEKEFVEKMKAALIKQKTEILEQLKSNGKDLKHLIETMESKDEIDFASDAVDGKMLELLGTKDSNTLKLIDNALTRIEQGKYGFCVKCGKPIPETRLEAIPYAFMCIDCKTQDERRNR